MPHTDSAHRCPSDAPTVCEPAALSSIDSRQEGVPWLTLSLERRETTGSEPFEAYLALREELGDRNVFLLESLAGPAADRRTAAVGFGPLLTVSVVYRIEIDGHLPLVNLTTEALGASGAEPSSEGLRLSPTCTLFDVPRVVESVFDIAGLDADSFGFGYFAFYGYDVVQHVEELSISIPALPEAAPDLTVTVYQGVAMFNLATGKVMLTLARNSMLPDIDVERVLALLASPADRDVSAQIPVPHEVVDSTTPEAFFENVNVALKHIAIGDIYQVQLGHEITIDSEAVSSPSTGGCAHATLRPIWPSRRWVSGR